MEHAFHVFVRQMPAGVAVNVLGRPHLASFAPDAASARADLAIVLRRLLERGELGDEPSLLSGARLRRVDLLLRAVVARRLLEVPMRFSVICHGADKKGSGLRVLVPRLGLAATVEESGWEAWVEEMIRHELYLAPLDRLLAVGWQGPESLETLSVTARPADEPRATPRVALRRAAPPPGLGEACRLLNDEVATLERAFERSEELALLTGILGARTRASVLLVGPAGAGKTALVHELAHRAARQEKDALEVWTTSGGRIVAGMRYLGEWQARVERIVDALRGRRAVLHLESLVELLSVGQGSDGTDVARFLVPAIEAGEIAMILEAAPEDVARAERTHAALLAALRPVAVRPLDAAEAREALAQTAGQIARRRRVKLDAGALERALDLAERFGDGVLPGEAVALLRAAAQPGARAVTTVGADEVTAAFSARTGYPRSLIDPAVRLDPAEVLAALRARVDGQDEATELLANLVVTLKTNLADPRRPLGSFLLLGPTGVGKTESALALASYLFGDARRLQRFDMAEYAAPGSAARLVAASSGAPDLARRVREQPFGVVLLDEIEKADPGVHDLLLQVLGEGRLTDGTGRTVSFRNTIVILTSNLGAESAGRSLGFGGRGDRAAGTHYRAAAAAAFRPELLNRFDQIVPYRPLGADVVRRLAARMLASAVGREGLLRRGVRVEWTDDVVARLAVLGFEPTLGARPLKRAIETHVVAPLARLLARTASSPPALVRLEVDEGGAIVMGTG